ncbi:MAG: YiiD C-terminal domain-containing protein [Rhodanobacter sp.]
MDAARAPLARALVDFMRDTIPLARSMDVRLAACAADTLALGAPLAPNVNDKGCAFGGSLVSVMTLAGWALVELALRQRAMDCDLFVGESTVAYLAPVWQDFRAEARLCAGSDLATFLSTLNARGRARIEIACTVPADNGLSAATLRARFVAKRRSAPPAGA